MIIDFNKSINEQWKDQTTTTSHTAATADEKVLATTTFNTEIPSTIDIYNFPRKSKSIVATSKNKEKLIELFDLIESKNETTLKFNESEDLFVSEEFKHFKEVQFDIFPLTMDVNKLFTDFKQLLQLKNMTIICKFSPEIACHEVLDMLKYVLVLKNKNYPGIVIIKDEI